MWFNQAWAFLSIYKIEYQIWSYWPIYWNVIWNRRNFACRKWYEPMGCVQYYFFVTLLLPDVSTWSCWEGERNAILISKAMWYFPNSRCTLWRVRIHLFNVTFTESLSVSFIHSTNLNRNAILHAPANTHKHHNVCNSHPFDLVHFNAIQSKQEIFYTFYIGTKAYTLLHAAHIIYNTNEHNVHRPHKFILSSLPKPFQPIYCMWPNAHQCWWDTPTAVITVI